MTLKHKVELFLKLAEDTEEAEYRKFVASLATLPLYEIKEQIVRYQNKPYFKIEDFTEEMFDKMFNTTIGAGAHVWLGLESIRKSFLLHNFNQNNIKRLMDFFVLKLIDKYPFENSEDIIRFLTLSSVIDDAIFQRGQRKIILTLMRWAKNDLFKRWGDIYQANVIDHNFMMQLAKVAGPDFYRKFFNIIHKSPQSYVKEKHKTLEQETLDVSDVAIYVSQGSTLDKKTLLTLIDKSSYEAKNYMRQFLYCDNASNKSLLDDAFILDENMMPMNRQYQTVKIPRDTYVTKVSSWPEEAEIRKVWSKVFEEFNLIPA